ncbi:MAG TPA: flagellar basal body P-ring protein FlgI, partial [Steroidobacteraceae bacterium]|nr:flagellar basal body P-ring protein FlgI [Steroidobacteraceae bacterium]
TGDSSRSLVTSQTMSNLLREFGLQVPADSINSRNVAVVLVTANLPPFVRAGDHLDVNVSSVGDATSLSGGTLLLTQLIGADRSSYAVAQGALSIAGFRFEQAGSLAQKNHATSGLIPEGAIIQRTIVPAPIAVDGSIDLLLNEPDFTTAQRVSEAINRAMLSAAASTVDAGRVRLHPGALDTAGFVSLMAAIENLSVEPSVKARVIVNERTGTIVAGGEVWISQVTVAQGDIRVAINQQYLVSQPYGPVIGANSRVGTVVAPEAQISVDESQVRSVTLPGATIEELVKGLHSIRASSRDVIAILQGIKRAGALHAELIIQ